MTIDVNRINLSPEAWQAVEALANQIVIEDRSVRSWFPEPDELTALALRKLPDVEGKVRVVDIGGFDITACGGTHVARSGEIGLIKIVRYERRNNTTRLEFKCGVRSLLDYRDKNDVINRLVSDLTVGYWELPDAIRRMQDESKTLRSELKAAREQLVEAEAASMGSATSTGSNGLRIVAQAFENRDVNNIRLLAQKLTMQPGTIALLGVAGEKAQLIFSRSDDLATDMAQLLKTALAVLGSDRGGGRPNLAQGGGIPATLDQLTAAIRQSAEALRG